METVKISVWVTYGWAAEALGVSVSQVARYVAGGQLEAVTPLVGPRESARHKRMILREQVLKLREARTVIGRGRG
jgi:hypothetical protein